MVKYEITKETFRNLCNSPIGDYDKELIQKFLKSGKGTKIIKEKLKNSEGEDIHTSNKILVHTKIEGLPEDEYIDVAVFRFLDDPNSSQYKIVDSDVWWDRPRLGGTYKFYKIDEDIFLILKVDDVEEKNKDKFGSLEEEKTEKKELNSKEVLNSICNNPINNNDLKRIAKFYDLQKQKNVLYNKLIFLLILTIFMLFMPVILVAIKYQMISLNVFGSIIMIVILVMLYFFLFAKRMPNSKKNQLKLFERELEKNDGKDILASNVLEYHIPEYGELADEYDLDKYYDLLVLKDKNKKYVIRESSVEWDTPNGNTYIIYKIGEDNFFGVRQS